MHPTTKELEAFGRGEVAEPEASSIEDHLAACAECQTTLDLASSDDRLMELFRSAAGAAPSSRVAPDHHAERDDDTGKSLPARPPARSRSLPTGYELIEPLGHGGMGVVYKALQRALGRVVALKQIAAGLDAEPDEITRFQTEAEAAARLKHPNIVAVFDVGEQHGMPYLAMELVEGGSLADRLKAGSMPPREAAHLVTTLARAVQHAHDSGVIHRDLKPANVLVAPDGAPKIADFGLAKRLDVSAAQTGSGALLGTPQYMAPEQAAGRHAGPAVDIYALGVVLYECLTGRPPFQAATPLEALDQVRSMDPPPPSGLRPGLPRDLETICVKCLEKEPRRRYPSAAALADDLARFLRGEPIAARPIGPGERLAKWVKRRPYQAALAALAALATGAALGGLIAHNARLAVEIERANRNAENARKQKALADTNYREARGAIVAMLKEIDDPAFANLPRRSELRRALSEKALVFYDKLLAAADSPDPKVRMDTADALHEAASVMIPLGRHEAAEAYLLRSTRLYEGVAAEQPDNLGLVEGRLKNWVKLGVMLSPGDTERGLQALERARVLVDRLAAGRPGSVEARVHLAWCEHNIGSTLLRASERPNRAAEAAPHLRRAAELYRELCREAPEDRDRINHLAGTLINLGTGDWIARRLDEAERSFQEATDLMQASLPGKASFDDHFVAAQLLLNRGNLALERNQPDAALAHIERGIAIVGPILKVEPADKPLREVGLMLHGSRAQVLSEALNRYAEAAAEWDRAIALYDGAVVPLTYRMSRASCLIQTTDYEKGLTAAEELARQLGTNTKAGGADLYQLASLFGLAVKAANRDGRLEGAARDRRARSCANAALAWLNRAAAAGWFQDAAHVARARDDAAFSSLRNSDDFRRALGLSPRPLVDTAQERPGPGQ
jgi:tetratricopeptide (TPR) repeat protein